MLFGLGGREIAPIFDLENLEIFLSCHASRIRNRLRAVGGGVVHQPPTTLLDHSLLQWAKAHYSQGDTIVLTFIDDLCLHWNKVAKIVGDAIGGVAAITVFATPPFTRGFAPHFDTQDVFVVQCRGCKTWEISNDIVTLPTKRQGFLLTPADHGRIKPLEKIKLQQGNVLYLPRGFVHAATAEREGSIHLSIDIHPVRPRDMLMHWPDTFRTVIGIPECDTLRKDLETMHSTIENNGCSLVEITKDARHTLQLSGRPKENR